MIILLWIAFFLHQADRQIFNVVLPLIRADLQLSDAQLGLVASVLVATYAVFVPVAGYVGDIVSKRNIVAFSLIFWSGATLLTGSSTTLIHLILLRSVATGGGEALYAPAANTLISEYHHQTRAFALSVHQTAVYFGIILSGLLAGYIGEMYGWRAAFFIFGGFGILLGVVIRLRLKSRKAEPALLLEAKKNYPARVPPREALLMVFRKPTAIFMTLAFACMVFVNVGYLTWMPTFLVEDFGLSVTQAGFSSVFYHHLFAFFGVLVGGKLSDRWAQQRRSIRLTVQGISLFAAVPFIYGMGASTHLPITYTCLAIFGFFRGVYDSSIFASLYEVIPPRYRSSASGMMLMGAFLAGAFAPYLLGVFKPTLGLATGLSWLSFFYVLAAVAMFIGVRFFFHRDACDVNIPEEVI
ncbi:MAG: MFS transporter [Tunicatimonas sp.]